MKRLLSTVFLAGIFALAAFAPTAQAFKVISTGGEGAGQTKRPNGLAVNYETGRLYVADTDNNRVSVFDSNGAFEKAFGWGVKTGESKFEICTATCRKGLAGDGGGQFYGGLPTNPSGNSFGALSIAVDNSCTLHKPEPLSGAACEAFDPSNGDVYVVDLFNQRVQKFDQDGNFILTFGGGVDKTVPGNICTAASGHTCGAGADEFVDGAFSSRGGIFVAVGPGGVVYVVDNFSDGGKSSFKYRLQRFNPDGTLFAPQQVLQPEEELAKALAVDLSGDFYVAGESGGAEAIRKYELGNGAPIDVIAERGDVLAVDSADHLFAARIRREGSAERRSIAEYDPSGNILRRFAYGLLQGNLGGLAPYSSANGDIYASEREGLNRILHIDFPDPGPIVYPEACKAGPVGNTKATLKADINPEGKATTFHFEYVDQKSFESFEEEEEESGWLSPAVEETPESDLIDAESEAIATDFVLHEASAQTGVLVPETTYRCRVVASNADDPEVIGEEGTFTTLEPLEIGSTWASEVTTEAATLNAEVNPLGIPTTAYFQYVDEATFQESGFAQATKAPTSGPIEFGAGEAFEVGSAQITGLKPDSVYRYRIVATDVLIAPKEIAGPIRRLRTYRAGAAFLPDGRRYELVSPALKNNAEVGPGPGVAAGTGAITIDGYTAIQAGSASGEALTYTSWTAFADPKSAPSSSQYLARRTATGWQTENIFPGGSSFGPLKPPFSGFDSELAFGALKFSNPPLAGCPETRENLYLRESAGGALACLTPEAPDLSALVDKTNLCLDFAGASTDGKRAFFAANAPYPGTGAPAGGGFSLYEWSEAQGLRLASVLPNGNPAVPTSGTAFGAGGLHCSTAEKVLRNVVSSDGGRAFWTYAPPPSKKEAEEGKQPARQLLARIGDEETIQLDKKLSGSGSSGNGVFLAASRDGSKVLFASRNKLITGAGEDDLYLYDFDAETKLKDLTPGGAGVEGMVGASDDGSHAYFVADAVLSGEEENSVGQKAQAGANNLYLYREGKGIDFVAVLGDDDLRAWESRTVVQSARVSPDGRHLAFLSTQAEALAGYDNTVTEGTHCRFPTFKGKPLEGSPLCPQAFLYDADTGELRCASCNPTGARPTGPTSLPGWTNSFEGPRYLSSDGARLFFESLDAIVPQDENEKRDVYEFELEGKGSCNEESPSFDGASGGCHYLISSGKSEDESYLIDASAEGRDVFFSTRSALLGRDPDGNYDIYDAREGGGFPEPSLSPPCEGEGCKPPPPAPAGTSPSPATATFQGPGNAKGGPTRCRKGKVRRRGRCVRPHRKSKSQRPRHGAEENRRNAQ